MRYSKYGEIARREIYNTIKLRKDKAIEITNWVIMPNHIHLLIEISHDPLFDSYAQSEAFSKPTKQSVATIIRSYKSAVTRRVRQELFVDDKMTVDVCGHGTPCPYIVWQHGYFDNIIRNEKMYEKVQHYISSNPMLWDKDCNNESSF